MTNFFRVVMFIIQEKQTAFIANRNNNNNKTEPTTDVLRWMQERVHRQPWLFVIKNYVI